MRLWHKDLIAVLPRQQLLGQWRECCAIAKSIAEKGTPNHILVNRIMDYPMTHFYSYGRLVCAELQERGYKVTQKCIKDFTANLLSYDENAAKFEHYDSLFQLWHNDRYYLQCYFNLEEKYFCGGVPEEEWAKIATYNHQRALEEWIEQWKEDHFIEK